MFRSSLRWSRVRAAVCGVAVLLGATACHDGGSTMKAGMGQESGPTLDTDGEPFIHANHNRGAEPGKTYGDAKSLEEVHAYEKEFIEWGLKQTPDWLEICNTINKRELRKFGIDPQKDLLDREGGEGKRWICMWKHNSEKIMGITWVDGSMEVANSRPNFVLDHTTTVNGKKAYVGSLRKNYPLSQSCAVNYMYQGKVYTVSYQLGTKPESETAACDAALALAERD